MAETVISVEHLSKAYRLGQIGTGRLVDDLKVWWAKARGKPNPLLKIGQKDHGNRDGETIWALSDVSFTVKQGEVLGVIGSNGAGKSTLLKIISQITAPTSGCIKAKGRVASLLEVGTGFHPDLTGRENTYLNGAILGMKKPEIDRKFDEVVAFSEVEQFIDTPVKRYSSGMYVRLAFAVAAHLDPEILLVDEVLAVGDAAFQRKCIGKMGDVARGGRTVLFVSHNLGAVTTLCHRTIWLDKGQLRMDSDSSSAVEAYLGQRKRATRKSLSDRSDRTGSGEVRFVGCRIARECGGSEVNEFLTGEEVFIHIDLEARSSISVFVGLQVKDSLGRKVTSFNSREGGFEPLLKTGMNRLVLHIPGLLLLEGQYSIDGSVVRVSNAARCDLIERIAEFGVYPSDFCRTGSPFRAYHGVFFHHHIWNGPNSETVNVTSERPPAECLQQPHLPTDSAPLTSAEQTAGVERSTQ
ncbi:MAG: ABC transporter ATP-binding protein [candidate division WOR-3 bacterium]|nr:MAG: ABC transporter ATP-binding protein [candidate division WOR-3 bacterium]